MARRATQTKSKGKSRKTPARSRPQPLRWLRRWLFRLVLLTVGIVSFGVGLYAILNPISGFYMKTEELRLGSIDHEWIAFEEIAPVMARSTGASTCPRSERRSTKAAIAARRP